MKKFWGSVIPPVLCQSTFSNFTPQSIQRTLKSLVALKELPQQGQIYFLVLLGFLGRVGASEPLLDVPPVNPVPKEKSN